MDVGAELREARERRGISLEELARITKIGVATLRALERNQVDYLPGGIFLRGFLRRKPARFSSTRRIRSADTSPSSSDHPLPL